MSAFYDTVARFYDAETSDRTDDLAFYSELVGQTGGPVLDVGCGTGRVLLHLAQEGVEAWGVDDSRAMLDRLARKLRAMPHLAPYVKAEQGDILKYETGERFALVLLTYNALMHFHDQDIQIALLTRLRGLLKEDGLLVLDLPNAGETFATQETDALIHDRSFIEPESGHLVMLHSTSYLDRATQLLRVQWIYDEITGDGTLKRLVVPHVLRYFFEPEIRLLLKLTGYEVEAVYGDMDENPFEDGSERMIVTARPA